MNNRPGFFLLFCLLFFFSCKRGTVPVASAPAEPENVNKITVSNLDYTYFTSRGRMQLESSSGRQSSAVTIRMKKDSVIWVSVVPLLGIEAARAKITRDSIQIVDRINKTYYAGNFALLKERYNVDLNFDILQNLIIGNYTPAPPGAEVLVAEEPMQHTRQRRGDLTVEQYVGPANHKLVRLEAQDPNSANRLSADYTNFTQLGAWPFATSVLVGVKGQRDGQPTTSSLSINHSQVSITESNLDFPFSVPANYERK